jgi:hypothetical protein
MNHDTKRLEWAKEALTEIVIKFPGKPGWSTAYDALVKIATDEQSTGKPTHPAIARTHG